MHTPATEILQSTILCYILYYFVLHTNLRPGERRHPAFVREVRVRPVAKQLVDRLGLRVDDRPDQQRPRVAVAVGPVQVRLRRERARDLL